MKLGNNRAKTQDKHDDKVIYMTSTGPESLPLKGITANTRGPYGKSGSPNKKSHLLPPVETANSTKALSLQLLHQPQLFEKRKAVRDTQGGGLATFITLHHGINARASRSKSS